MLDDCVPVIHMAEGGLKKHATGKVGDIPGAKTNSLRNQSVRQMWEYAVGAHKMLAKTYRQVIDDLPALLAMFFNKPFQQRLVLWF